MPSMPANSSNDCPQQYLYEYAVVQFVPDIERGEFINIGLVMMCKKQRWLRTKFSVNSGKVSAICPDVDLDLLQQQIVGFERVGAGDSMNGGSIAALEPHERFRWLTAVRSACLQTSRPHAGHTSNLDNTFSRLFASLVQ